MKNRTAVIAASVAAAAALVVAAPATASPGPKHVDRDHRHCVSKEEWLTVEDHITAGHHPLVADVEKGWEVKGLGWDAILDLDPWFPGVEWASRAFPRCGYQDRPEVAWWGFAMNKRETRVVTLTGYKAEGAGPAHGHN